MRRLILLSLTALFALTLFGCGDSHPQPQLFSTQILSNASFDGDIENTVPETVRRGNLASLFLGFDASAGTETRAFVDFSISTVPVNAIINSATLTFFTTNIQFNGLATSVPVRIDLVSFDPPILIGSDFDRPFLLTTTITPALNRADIGHDVTVDITPLMTEAQRHGLAALQLRLVAQTPGGLVEINDTNAAPPQLDVTFF